MIIKLGILNTVLGLFIYLYLIHKYPVYTARNFNDKTLANYRMYRTIAYIKYAFYFLLPPIVVILILLFHHPSNDVFASQLQLLANLLLSANYITAIISDHNLGMHFSNTGKHCYKYRTTKEDSRYVAPLFILMNILALIGFFIAIYLGLDF